MHFRENKNKFVLSYLASLIHEGVFSQVIVTFLLKGHTGNQVNEIKNICVVKGPQTVLLFSIRFEETNQLVFWV